MTIDQLVAMAQRIHDREGYNLGAKSTRDYRNAFWARVIGCAYHGHPVYNATPDRQWHLKSAGGGRPQTDDVATSMPSRAYWDCIAGVGADGYRFTVNGHAEPLPLDQEVYPPPVPAGSSGGGGGNGGGGGGTQPTCQYQATDLAPVLARLNDLDAAVAAATEAAREAQAAAVQTRAMIERLIAQLQSPGMALDASVRVLGPIRGTVRLP